MEKRKLRKASEKEARKNIEKYVRRYFNGGTSMTNKHEHYQKFRKVIMFFRKHVTLVFSKYIVKKRFQKMLEKSDIEKKAIWKHIAHHFVLWIVLDYWYLRKPHSVHEQSLLVKVHEIYWLFGESFEGAWFFLNKNNFQKTSKIVKTFDVKRRMDALYRVADNIGKVDDEKLVGVNLNGWRLSLKFNMP